MKNIDCVTERYSARTIGLVTLALAAAAAVIGGLVVPIIGLFFSLPLMMLSGLLLAAPQSKACKLITEKVNR